MDRPQQTLATLATGSGPGVRDLCMSMDEDVALGCECADPALQIDCWGEEARTLRPELD